MTRTTLTDWEFEAVHALLKSETTEDKRRYWIPKITAAHTLAKKRRPKRKSFNPKVSPPRFTDDQAREIWTEVAALGGKQQKIVAERWGINIAAVSKIWNGLHYKGATEELREAWKRHGCIRRIEGHG